MDDYTHERVRRQFTEAKGTSLARELLTNDFWMSGLAMLKYIPRSFRVKQVDGMAFFTEAKHDEFRNRALRITPANPRQWGTMNVPQMLRHLNLACGSPLGFYKLPDESYLVSRTVFRWILVDWFPEQPVGLRLPKGFKISPGAEFEFDFERQQLLKVVEAAWHARSPDDWGPHPMLRKTGGGRMGEAHSNSHRLSP